MAASRPQVLRLGTSARTLAASRPLRSSSPGVLPARHFRNGARGVHLPWQQSAGGTPSKGVIRPRFSVPLGGALAGRAWQPPAASASVVLIRVYSTQKSAAEDEVKASQGNVDPPTTDETANVEVTHTPKALAQLEVRLTPVLRRPRRQPGCSPSQTSSRVRHHTHTHTRTTHSCMCAVQ